MLNRILSSNFGSLQVESNKPTLETWQSLDCLCVLLLYAVYWQNMHKLIIWYKSGFELFIESQLHL